jgi:2-methylcitrate dehydratase PrpD
LTATTITISEELARWARTWSERGLPDEVLERTQTFVLDWIASALAGRGTEAGGKLLDYTRSQPEGTSSVLGEPLGRSAESAAFANGALSHIVEMDDVDRRSIVHPGAVVIPAALAIAQRDGRNGREFLSAVVTGYEVAIRMGAAVGSKHYYHFHNTSTSGVFGSAMAAGWLLGLDEEEMAWALGSAGTMAFGLWEFNAEGAMSKHLHTGHAAASGLRAAELGARGFTGARRILEGERGFFAGMAPEGDPAVVAQGLDEPSFSSFGFALPGVSLKPYASCRHTHAAIDAAMALRQRLGTRMPSGGTIAVYQAAADLCDNARPKTSYEAKFSLQFCVARALSGAGMGLSDFDADGVATFPLTVVVDPELDARFPQQFPARLRLELEDGECLEHEVSYPLGDPENPLSRERVEDKLFQLADFGGVPKELAQGYLDWVTRLPDASGAELADSLELQERTS